MSSASPMTRNARVTVRLPGASTAPATRTRTLSQTGAVKLGRNTASQAARIGGTNRRLGAARPRRFAALAVVESGRTDSARVLRAAETTAGWAVYCARPERSDRPAHRKFPLPPRAVIRRTPEPGLHSLSCRLRRSSRAAPADRAGRSRRGALLVALEGLMDQCRSVRAHCAAARRRAPVHRLRGHLLGCPLAGAREKAESRAKQMSSRWLIWQGNSSPSGLSMP